MSQPISSERPLTLTLIVDLVVLYSVQNLVIIRRIIHPSSTTLSLPSLSPSAKLSLSSSHTHSLLVSFERLSFAQSLVQTVFLLSPTRLSKTMHLKNSFLLATALTATSAVARLHGHHRRHAHPNVEIEAEPALPGITPAPELDIELEKRAVGDVVTATINGVVETWINQWDGEVAAASSSSSSSSSSSTETADVTPPPPPPADPTTSNPVESTVQPPPPSSSSGGNWFDAPSGGFSRAGFGGQSDAKSLGSLDWDYSGNVGIPWGSNIIEVAEADASQYKHVIRFEGSMAEPWSVIFWNSYGPNGELDGFFTPNKALQFTINKGEVKYVAIDENSQGGWAAAPGGNVPTNFVGQYAATWGEFDMSNQQNDAHSGWDVSCIIPQLFGMDIQGMKICNHLGEECSYIGKGLTALLNAYTSADQGVTDLAVFQKPGAVRLIATLDYVH